MVGIDTGNLVMGDEFIVIDCGAKALHSRVSVENRAVDMTKKPASILLHDEVTILFGSTGLKKQIELYVY